MWIDGGDTTGISVRIYNSADVLLVELPMVEVVDEETIPSLFVETTEGQRVSTEIEFKYQMVWNGALLHPPITLAVGTDKHSFRVFRWGGV